MLHPGWSALIMLTVIVAVVLLCFALFAGTFTSHVPVTLTASRAGLVMESGAKVKLRGVQVGRVARISGGSGPARLELELDPDQVQYIPANVQARIRATTAFGAKYVDLVYPSDPSQERLAAGAVLVSDNVSTEVNTVFQNLTSLLRKVDPQKLNGVLAAVAQGLRGKGQSIGQATTGANRVLLAVNPRFETIGEDWRSLQAFSDTYSDAAQDILSIMDAASTTSDTVTANASALDDLLLGVVGLARTGIETLAPAKDNLVTGINATESTTALLLKYQPTFTCVLVGSKKLMDPESEGGYGWLDKTAGNGRTVILDAGIMLGDDPYRYPQNLPVIGAKGGAGGAPSCGSLPDVSQNWPVRALVTDTGFGTGLDLRPNPGIGFPGWANYFPVTRAVPEPASVRNPGGPAPGPIPYPGAPPYGAQLYAPDGTPLYPGLPAAPPPGAPREAGPPPAGSEPFVVPNPMHQQPTPAPPLPPSAVPAP